MKASSEKQCKYGPMIDLRALEEETRIEAQEWGRRRLEEKVRARLEAFSAGEEKKLQNVQYRDVTLKTMFGEVVLRGVYGRDRESGEMVIPIRERLGLQAYQAMSPVLQDYLCFLAITCMSFGRAAESAKKIGIQVDGSQIQRLAQRAGETAEEQAHQRTSSAFNFRKRKEIVRKAQLELEGERFSLVLMLDGMMLRYRGKDWGMKPASASGERVAWNELKAGLILRIPESMTGKRRKVAKYYVASNGDPESIGRRWYAEALRRGLEQARRVYVIADGAVWIWNLAEEHFPDSEGKLDYYHASEHLWALARALWGDDEEKVQAWVSPLLRNLKHQGGANLLSALEELLRTAEGKWNAEQCKTLKREAAYFRSHESRLDYPKDKEYGVPLGSGAMESACSQIQGRFKRPGQFWTKPGERNLLALELAWRNRDWNEIWEPEAA